MLFWICIIILAIGVVCYYLYTRTRYDSEIIGVIGVAGLIIGIISVVSSLIVLGVYYIGIDGAMASDNIRYDHLVYQYENDIYENDNDLGKRELMVDIQNWNEDLARGREIQDDFWIGIYIPDVFDQYEFIELEKEKK